MLADKGNCDNSFSLLLLPEIRDKSKIKILSKHACSPFKKLFQDITWLTPPSIIIEKKIVNCISIPKLPSHFKKHFLFRELTPSSVATAIVVFLHHLEWPLWCSCQKILTWSFLLEKSLNFSEHVFVLLTSVGGYYTTYIVLKIIGRYVIY